MAEAIFTKITLQKRNLYNTIKTLLVDAGWQNISSNVADHDVFYSTGTSGDKNLYFQLRPIDYNDLNNIAIGNGFSFSCKIMNKYVPGVSGTSGSFFQLDIARNVTISNIAVPLDVDMDLYYNVNKNRLIFVTDHPNTINAYGNAVLIGLPDGALLNEIDSRGVVFAPNLAYPGPASNNILISSSSYKLTTALSQIIYTTLIPLGINSSRKFMFSQLAYGDATEGIRGVLDGIYTSNAGPFQHGDVFTEGSKKYKVMYQETIQGWSLGYNSKYIVFRIQ